MRLVDFESQLYVGEFTAPIGGSVVLSVNDAVFLWGGEPKFFYTDERGLNKGLARVRIDACVRADAPTNGDGAPATTTETLAAAPAPARVACLGAGSEEAS
jgi:hypothetical protein